MNEDKLDVIKQEMARVNINTVGISELKWTEMGKFNSDDHLEKDQHLYSVEGWRRRGRQRMR